MSVSQSKLMVLWLQHQKAPLVEFLNIHVKDIKQEMAASPEDFTHEDGDEPSMDVRLQVYPDGQWAIRTGLSDYDADHRGFWGASSIGMDTDSAALADILIEDVLDQVGSSSGEDDVDALEDALISADLLCASCFGHGYLEVTMADDFQHIRACENCAGFCGTNLDSKGADERAITQAGQDGYIMDRTGKILA